MTTGCSGSRGETDERGRAARPAALPRPGRRAARPSPSPRLVALVLSVASALAAGCAATREGEPGAWIDLTYAFSEDTVYWPTSERFKLRVLSREVTDAGYYYAANAFCTAEHGGTHMDAPIHFGAARAAADEVPIDRLIGPGVVVDVSEAVRLDRDHRVTVADLLAHEDEHGVIPDDAIVLLRTGFGAWWPDPVAYLGTDRRGTAALTELSFPGLHPDAARWLVLERGVAAVGIDTASIDYGRSALFETHQVLASHDVPVFENVAHLDQLPPRVSLVVALPMKIEGGSGGPLRIVARVP